MITAFGTAYDAADDSLAPSFPGVTVLSGEVTNIDFASSTFPILNLGQSNNFWQFSDGFGFAADGTYALARKATPVIPEPHAAMLFGVGSLVVATRLRRRPRD